MKKIALIVLAVAFLATVSIAKDKAPKAQKISGYITDAKCAKADKAGADHAACAKKCIEGGEKPVLVTSDKKILNIDNPDSTKGHEGDHVTVTGVVTGDSVHINKIAVSKAPKAKAEKKS
jgi:hypothetical protein